MSALFIARINVLDPEQYQKYLDAVPAVIAKYNGKPVARTIKCDTLEGPEENRRIVILEFPSAERAKEFYNSEEYRKVKKLRENAAIGEVIVTETI